MSKKKKQEKKKDFLKPKLKVGKAKPASTTTTNTSFIAKSIVLPTQSITKKSDEPAHTVDSVIPTASDQAFQRSLALCKHHSAVTRKESLVLIKNDVRHHLNSLRSILATVAPMIIDSSKSVREMLLEVFNVIPGEAITPHASFIMLYVHSAMTHLTPDIRAQSTLYLDHLLTVAPVEISRLCFAKTIACFFPLFGWPTDNTTNLMDSKITLASSTVTTSLSFGSNATKTKLAHLNSLQKLLQVGLDPALALSKTNADGNKFENSWFHPQTSKFLMPQSSSPFIALQLFPNSANAQGVGGDKSADPIITEDVTDRFNLVVKYWDALNKGLANTCKEGSQVGRLSSSLVDFLTEARAILDLNT